MENPDSDNLIYRLGYRQESESVWRPLGGPDPLTKAEFDWNTDSVPDGLYLVRVWVTDERSNSSDRALDSTLRVARRSWSTTPGPRCATCGAGRPGRR